MRLIDADEFGKQVAAMAIKENLPVAKVNAMLKVIDMQPSHPQWNPVEIGVPEEGDEVLATDGKYVYLVEYDSDYGYGDMDGITAWMPLPEPYRPEN